MSTLNRAHKQASYFETLRTYGGKPALLDAHIERLELTGVAVDARSISREVARQLEGVDGDRLIRIESDGRHTQVVVGELPEHARQAADRAFAAILCEFAGYAYPHKSTARELHRAAIAQANSAGAFEAIIHDDCQVIEGARTNVFTLHADRLATPPLGRCLPGVTRSTVGELAAELGLRFEARALATKELFTADEVFLTNALLGVRRVERIDDMAVGGGAPSVRGDLHAALLARYEARR